MMLPLRALMLSILLCAPAIALAQADGSQQPLEQAMTPEEFKAAGLDKLSPSELAALNGWLDRRIAAETTRAAAQAEDKVKGEARGFFNFGSEEAITSTIQGEFSGYAKGRDYTLANGQVWEQIDSARLDGVRKTNPRVTISPSLLGNMWYMRIEGYNKRAQVRRVK